MSGELSFLLAGRRHDQYIITVKKFGFYKSFKFNKSLPNLEAGNY